MELLCENPKVPSYADTVGGKDWCEDPDGSRYGYSKLAYGKARRCGDAFPESIDSYRIPPRRTSHARIPSPTNTCRMRLHLEAAAEISEVGFAVVIDDSHNLPRTLST